MSDSTRYPTVAPAADHVVPVPGRPTPLAAEGELVDRYDPYWAMALADGSVAIVAGKPATPTNDNEGA